MNTQAPGPVEADAAPSAVPGITIKELGAVSFSLAYALDLVGNRDPWLSFRLRMARNRLDELLAAARSPARRDPETSPQVLGIATTGPPVRPPVAAGKGPTPGPAAAIRSAACGSDGSVVASVAGASPGRGEHVDPSPRPDSRGGEGGSLPFPRLSLDLGVGPQYDALPRGESWLGR